jgi:hypothetical protein
MADEKIREIVKSVRDLRAKIQKLENDHEDIFKAYFDITDEYNAAIIKAKSVIRETEFPGNSMNYGDGFRAQKRTAREFIPEVLRTTCPEIFNCEGVVKAVDRDKVRGLLESGEVDPKSVNAAYQESTSVTVYGPKQMELKL